MMMPIVKIKKKYSNIPKLPKGEGSLPNDNVVYTMFQCKGQIQENVLYVQVYHIFGKAHSTLPECFSF